MKNLQESVVARSYLDAYPASEKFCNDLVLLAAHTCQTKFAALSFMDHGRERLKATRGFKLKVLPPPEAPNGFNLESTVALRWPAVIAPPTSEGVMTAPVVAAPAPTPYVSAAPANGLLLMTDYGTSVTSQAAYGPLVEMHQGVEPSSPFRAEQFACKREDLSDITSAARVLAQMVGPDGCLPTPDTGLKQTLRNVEVGGSHKLASFHVYEGEATIQIEDFGSGIGNGPFALPNGELASIDRGSAGGVSYTAITLPEKYIQQFADFGKADLKSSPPPAKPAATPEQSAQWNAMKAFTERARETVKSRPDPVSLDQANADYKTANEAYNDAYAFIKSDNLANPALSPQENEWVWQANQWFSRSFQAPVPSDIGNDHGCLAQEAKKSGNPVLLGLIHAAKESEAARAGVGRATYLESQKAATAKAEEEKQAAAAERAQAQVAVAAERQSVSDKAPASIPAGEASAQEIISQGKSIPPTQSKYPRDLFRAVRSEYTKRVGDGTATQHEKALVTTLGQIDDYFKQNLGFLYATDPETPMINHLGSPGILKEIQNYGNPSTSYLCTLAAQCVNPQGLTRG